MRVERDLLALVAAALVAAGGCGRLKPAARADAAADVGAAERAEGREDAGDVAPDAGDAAHDAETAADAPPDAGDGDGDAKTLQAGSLTATSVVVRPSGNVIVGGSFTGTVDLGLGPLVSAGEGDLFLAELSPAGAPIWNRRFGDAGYQTWLWLALDGDGSIYAAARLEGTLDLGGEPLVSAGMTDVALAKLDASGKHLWSKRWGDADEQIFAGLAVVASGVVLGVRTDLNRPNLRTELVSLTPAGEISWTKSWKSVEGRALARSAAGGPVLAASFWDPVDVGGGPLASMGLRDVLVVELTPAGDWVWSKRFGGYGDDSPKALAVDSGGRVLLAGEFNETIDFGGGPLVSERAPNRFSPSYDLFVAALGPGGAHAWSRRFGDTGSNQTASGLAAAAASGAVLTGVVGQSLAGSATDLGMGPLLAANGLGFIAALDAEGRVRWSQQLPLPPLDVRVAPSGAVLAAGSYALDAEVGRATRKIVAGDRTFLIEYAP